MDESIGRGSDFVDASVRSKTRSVLCSTDADGDIVAPDDESASDWNQSLRLSLRDSCGPCKVTEHGREVEPEWYCKDCQDFLCKPCMSKHKDLKATRKHTLMTYKEKLTSSLQIPCGSCKDGQKSKIVTSSWYCRNCDDFLCDKCRSYHGAVKVTKGHTIITSKEMYDEMEQNPSSKAKTAYFEGSEESTYTMHNVHDGKGQLNIIGSCFINNSSLLLTDDYAYLYLLCLRSSVFTLVAEKQFDSAPWGVAAYDPSEVSVVVGGRITRLSVTGNQITEKDKMIKLAFDCCVVAYVTKTTLAAVGISPATFCVVNTDGSVLWELDIQMRGPGMPIGLWGLATDKKTTAYVSIYDDDVVYKIDLSRNRKITSTFHLQQNSGPRGIAVDPDDNVYVCNYRNHTIQKITPDGVHIKSLLTEDRVPFPQSIAFSPDGNSFVVGSSSLVEEGEKIKLFRAIY